MDAFNHGASNMPQSEMISHLQIQSNMFDLNTLSSIIFPFLLMPWILIETKKLRTYAKNWIQSIGKKEYSKVDDREELDQNKVRPNQDLVINKTGRRQVTCLNSSTRQSSDIQVSI